ncbi:MAG: phosphohistidine phosphatase SixA [Burkholderiales bacterium]|nr:phosphohistidine phosphatase SixA [Burkholderiales bacterium]
MDLILWRHAEAVESHEGDDDLTRPLTAKGERQADRMAGWLGRQLAATTRVLVSPAIRAQQTARALERKFKTLDELAPEQTAQALLHAARWPDAREPVLVVGHQPALGMTVGYLMTGETKPWSIRKGGVIWLRGRERDGVLQVVLHAALTPELV